MATEQLLEEKYYSSCFTLSREDIMKFDEQDNGPINNVLVGIAHQCYGTRLYDDMGGLSVEMFYINRKGGLSGDIICLEVKDADYYALLLRFCVMLSQSYGVDALSAFNTFQQKLRGFLEKIDFFTVSSLELAHFKGQDAVMANFSVRGIVVIDLIDHKEFYRDFFGNINTFQSDKTKMYVYLMVNSDTGLIKIGKSNNPSYRERTLHSQEPSIYLVAVWCCAAEVERELHQMFSHKRIRGEWFRLTIADLVTLETYMTVR